MPNDNPDSPPPAAARPVSWQLGALCVLLGLICLAFPFVGQWIEPTLFPTEAYLLSLCMAFGMFLTAVGGWASGKWRGWTFGGAAATVVALFLLILFTVEPPDITPDKALVVKVHGESLYTDIAAVEVLEENGARLFVAPNRELRHANVLIEASNLDTDCLVFMFAPNPRAGSAEGDAEPIDVRVLSGFFRDALEAADEQGQARHRMQIYYHHPSRTLLRKVDAEPISGPGICSPIAAVHRANDPHRAGLFDWISAAFAGELNEQELIRQLISEDALTRRDAREQIASRGPEILPALMATVPDPAASTHYRYALGAVTALAQMVRVWVDLAEIHAMLSEADIERVVGLIAHPDKTMRKWATAAVIRLVDDRTVEPLIAILSDDSTSPDGKYNAALALRETASAYPETIQRRIVDETQSLKASLGPRTALLLDQLPTADVQAAKTGWVYLGARFGKGWSERYFHWDGDPEAPTIGAEIDATGNVNLRADHIRFTLTEGWKNSEIVGLIRSGQSVTVRRVKEVHPGFFWAEIEVKS